MSSFPNPNELVQVLEDYSFKLDDFKRKFNPYFSQISFELKEKVDQLKSRLEVYAHYYREHQLKHLLESQRVFTEISAMHLEVESLHSKMRELDRVYKLGQNLS